MTTAQARKAGFEINRGAYQGTCDDRIDRWYIERVDANIVDRRGSGFATRRDALERVAEIVRGMDCE